MTGDRIGFAVGNKQLVSGLTKVKSQIDSGPPVYIQKVAVKALQSYKNNEPPDFLKKNNQVYKERRDVLIERLCSLGFKCEQTKSHLLHLAKLQLRFDGVHDQTAECWGGGHARSWFW